MLGYLGSCQTFQGIGDSIPTDGSPIILTVDVTGIPDKIDSSFGIESVCFSASHTWIADIHIVLIAPDGTQTLLVDNIGGDQDSFLNTCLDNKASQSIFEVGYPYTGTFKPLDQLGNNNNGQNPNGTWTLYVYDTYPFADDGIISDWRITFGDKPSLPFVWKSSSLPIIKFYTDGKSIGDEPPVNLRMQVVDNGKGSINTLKDTLYKYNGFANVEWRGQTSNSFPKKSFRVETADSLGRDSSIALLGLPKESDWVLHASFSDKTLMRNVLSHYIFSAMGHYSSRTRFCEVFIDNFYQGVYVLEEKVKRDKNRVDVAKLKKTDINGNDVTGGYIIKCDKGDDGGWLSKKESVIAGTHTYYQYVYPKKDSLIPEQAAYIQSYIDSIETALFSPGFTDSSGFKYDHYLDLPSFVDNFIVNELSKNIDAYRLSTYFYKKKDSDGGKLFAGPLWDFDLSFRNAGFCTGENYEGWIFDQYCDYSYWAPPMFFYKMFKDSSFWNTTKCRWEELRKGILNDINLNQYIDDQALSIFNEQKKNFEIWPILGVYVWPNPGPLAFTYEEEISQLKNWIYNRMQWIDKYLPGNNSDCFATESYENLESFNVKVYPNPAKNYVTININDTSKDGTEIYIYDIFGKNLKNQIGINGENLIDLKNIKPGLYMIKVINNHKVLNLSKLLITN